MASAAPSDARRCLPVEGRIPPKVRMSIIIAARIACYELQYTVTFGLTRQKWRRLPLPEFRRKLHVGSFRFIGVAAVFRFPEEQPVDQVAGPCADACLFPPPASAAQCLVGPAHEQGVQELIKADEDVFSVGHAASTSSAVAAASTAALRSPPRCIVPFLCFMAPSA